MQCCFSHKIMPYIHSWKKRFLNISPPAGQKHPIRPSVEGQSDHLQIVGF